VTVEGIVKAELYFISRLAGERAPREREAAEGVPRFGPIFQRFERERHVAALEPQSANGMTRSDTTASKSYVRRRRRALHVLLRVHVSRVRALLRRVYR
jgi:hypothetical protein